MNLRRVFKRDTYLIKVRNIQVDIHSCHTGLAIVTREGYAVHSGLAHPRIFSQDLGDLGSAHVLPLPPEGIPQPIEEEPAAVGVAPQRITRAIVAVALAEDVVHELLGRGLLILEVAGERGGDGRWLSDEDLAPDLVRHARREPRLLVPHYIPRLRVHGYRYEDTVEPPPAQEAVVPHAMRAEIATRGVVEGQDALGRVEELVDRLDAEALAERHPYVWAQAIAVDGAHRVLLVERRGRRREEVPQRLTDIDEPRRPRGAHVLPEA
ncbi:hypothetical protein RRF57_009070 [Xylaria bambusicola]|uniref:Uncharacterized protein n=1 Tax=Xylaria bambusicola TaxID=326684 RepID=A0AAN7UQD4_9PEZI